MKIDSIEVIPLSYLKQVPPVRRSFAVVRVRSDSGLVGYGEASDCYGHQTPLVIAAIVEEELSRFALGEDPTEIERLVAKLRGHVGRFLGYQGPVIQAISGLEIACWDILGKQRGEPICRLLGGPTRDRVPLYAAGTIGHDLAPGWQREFFRPQLERGFRAVKVRVGKSIEWDVELVRTVRDLVGPEATVLADAASNYTVPTAIRMAKAFAESRVAWLEEPVPEYDLDGMAQVVAESPIPIAYGEHTATVHGFRSLIRQRAATVLQPDATVCGGLLEAQRICALARAHGLRVAPHSGGLTAIGIAANLHLCAAIPAVWLLEYDAASDAEQPLRDRLLAEPILGLERVRDGQLPVPTGPGLGLAIDESAFAAFPYIKRGLEPALPVYGVPHL